LKKCSPGLRLSGLKTCLMIKFTFYNVKLKDLKTKEEFCYKLVSAEEADLEKDKISVTSPIGKALLGRKIGEEVDIEVPAGKLKYKIVDIYK
jgi:transcription elongation factor GreA